jgi:hypothetical protein
VETPKAFVKVRIAVSYIAISSTVTNVLSHAIGRLDCRRPGLITVEYGRIFYRAIECASIGMSPGIC